MDQLATHNKTLENQIAQQASSSSKPAGKLPKLIEERDERDEPSLVPCGDETHTQKRKKNDPEISFGIFPQWRNSIQEELQWRIMPSYAKFLKEILSKKRKLEDYGTVALTEECSAILQNKLPPKLKDPGSFSIPCIISNKKIDKALCDLLASIGELKPTTISLQLADRSVKYPVGIIENIPIKVGKFFIPVDFIVLEMEEDFNLFDTMKHKFEPDEFFKVDIIDKQVKEEFHKTHPKDPLEACIVHSHIVDDKNTEIAACAQQLEEQTKGKLQENSKQVELKPLPFSLRYAFLDSKSNYPVIINASLSKLEEKKLLRELRIHSKALGYKIEDLKGINPSICMHRIPMEENNSFKFLFTQNTKKRQHSLVPMEHLHIEECLSVFVMPLLPFKDA
ncbi:hypothetical protein P3X46_002575 [Hevea brasiliensis]|uniref:Uncharacterized protein n=1 Tax=Hevea brasiliensis TaxID=3981 RepID=A0ABQ9N4F9_HEVBR|nr:hypothetical protein P3X46_002575 [Hevea brasiliensis]